MTQTLEAAFHEAGHAVLAHLSEYHIVSGSVSLASYGGGLTAISPSRKKLTQAGKNPASYASDPDVAEEMASILAAGIAAEHIGAAFRPGLSPNPVLSKPDHQAIAQITAAAGLTGEIAQYQHEAARVLCLYWEVLANLADALYKQVSIDAVEAVEIIEHSLPK